MKLDLQSAVNDIVFCFVDSEPVTAILEVVGHVPQSVVEVGAASGKLSIKLATLGAEAVVIDHDPEMVHYETHLVEAARSLLRATGFDGDHLNVQTALMDGRRLELPTGAFELAFNEGVLEHLPWVEQVQMLREMARVSRDYVAFIVPVAGNTENERIAREVHHHYHGLPATETPLTPADCEGLAEKAGLTVVQVRPILDRLMLVTCRKQVRKV